MKHCYHLISLFIVSIGFINCFPPLAKYDSTKVNQYETFSERLPIIKKECDKAYSNFYRYVKYQPQKDALIYFAQFTFYKNPFDVILPSEYEDTLGTDYTMSDLLNSLTLSVNAMTVLVIEEYPDKIGYVSKTLTTKKDQRNIYQFYPKYLKELMLSKEKQYEIMFDINGLSHHIFGYKQGQLDIYQYNDSEEKYELIDFELFKENMDTL